MKYTDSSNYLKKAYCVFFIFLSFIALSCSRKTHTEIWRDNVNQEVPVKVTKRGDTNVYDFGTTIMRVDTTSTDTIK